MTTLSAPPAPLDPDAIRDTVDTVLYGFLDEQEHAAPDLLPELALFTGLLRDFLAAGGKRIRPLLCITGWAAITDQPPPPLLWRAAASLELFHAFALIHDDVMDHSATRRGHPTAHRTLTARHQHHPDAENLGTNAAILLGDLALGWSYELLHSPDATPDQLASAWPLWNALRTETLIGQYLDLTVTGSPTADAVTAWRIIRYKTAKYTVERPLHLGATLAGATDQQFSALSAYALPLGEAFQLRDDLIGIWGNPTETGKSALDDLREGKHTVLYATALERATVPQQRALRARFGHPDLTEADAAQIRSLLTDTGARTATEQFITDRYERARQALDTDLFRPTGREALTHLAALAATRTC
ncbi:polyprenyl synthetase family protein [Streptomyces sp. b94]|uniref:polyprenyl synthetase family protein n=1 Tax=Streptomyces sp. b94 TaxID=1827634 RepID=UPI001B37BF44|nr:polyprenyl synthetase family protein [Streptomyces sp. b94]MBQ1095043.1 polyprenyl synthetase family protein [Streptomyces sp. b94]